MSLQLASNKSHTTNNEQRTTNDGICYRCGSDKSGLVLIIDDNIKIVRCTSCRLARTYPYPQFNFESQEKYASFYLDNEDLFRSFARSMMSSAVKYKRAGNFLDIGCSVGYLLDEAKKQGFVRTSGIELNIEAAQISRKKGHQVYSQKIEEIDFGNDRFDVISFNHVLEHIYDFRPFLAKVKALLKPDGIVYSGTPNYNSFMRRLLGKSWYGWGMPDHVWHFDPDTFRSVMNEAGFKSIEFVQNELFYPYSRSLRKNTRATLARVAGRLGMGDQIYGIFTLKNRF